jgi:hypothetical protein
MEGFCVQVHNSAGDPFDVDIPAADVTVKDVKKAIEASVAGRQLEFTLLWKIYLANEAGEIVGLALDHKSKFPASQGSTVNVRVQLMGGGESLGGRGMRRALSSNDSDVCPLRFLLHIRAGAGVVAAPQGGESNPHARDAGARAWRERRKRPFVFGAPLFVVVARPVAHPLPLASRQPFGVSQTPVVRQSRPARKMHSIS